MTDSESERNARDRIKTLTRSRSFGLAGGEYQLVTTTPVIGSSEPVPAKSNVSSAACHSTGLTVLPVCGPMLRCRVALGEAEHGPDRRGRCRIVASGGRPLARRLAGGAGRRRRAAPALREPPRSRHAADGSGNERLAATASKGRNNERTWQNPWRRLPAARYRQACARKEPRWKRRVFGTVAANLGAVRGRIAAAARAAGRAAGAVTLVAVSKTQPAEAVRAALAAGQRVFGENRVQEALAKFPACAASFPTSNCT